MANKITKTEMFNSIKSHLTDPAEIAFIEHELELIANKAARAKEATRKPTATQTANIALKSDIVAYMASTKSAVTIADIKAKFDLTSQKVTPLMNALVDEGKLSKVVEKRTAHYTLV